jgi:hypothetical protein
MPLSSFCTQLHAHRTDLPFHCILRALALDLRITLKVTPFPSSEPWGRGRAAASCDNQVRIHLPLRLCYLLSYINCTPIRPLRDQTDLISCCRHGPAASSTSNPNPQRATEDTPTTPGSAMAGCTLQLPVVSSNRSTGTGTAMPARSAVRPSDSPSTPPGPMAF